MRVRDAGARGRLILRGGRALVSTNSVVVGGRFALLQSAKSESVNSVLNDILADPWQLLAAPARPSGIQGASTDGLVTH